MSDRRPRERPRIEVGFEWTCPFCGESRTNRSTGSSGRENATAALRTHVGASDGGGHGPRNELPPGFDVVSPEEYVVRVDDRE